MRKRDKFEENHNARLAEKNAIRGYDEYKQQHIIGFSGMVLLFDCRKEEPFVVYKVEIS